MHGQVQAQPPPTRSDFDAAAYARASSCQGRWGRALIDSLELRGDERVLDIGCGDGRLTADLARRLPSGHVLGIDSSPAMIASAEVSAGSRLRFELLDAAEMDFDAEFDMVFSNAALHWVCDHPRLLRAVRRSLAAGGRFEASFAGQGNCPNLERSLREAVAQPEFAGAFAGFRWPWTFHAAAEYETLLVKAGFAWHRAELCPADQVFDNIAAMMAWTEQPCLVPFLAQLASAQAEAFRAFVRRRMVAATIQDDGTCAEQFRRLNVTATKPEKT